MRAGLSTRWTGRTAIAAVVFLAATSGLAQVGNEAQRSGLEAACRARMDDLQQVEAKNLEAIEWQDRADGIRGTYVGYNPAYRCTLGSGSDAGASGRMTYQEVVYEKHGSSRKAARLSVPRPLEIHEVTLVLVEQAGEWR